MKPYLPSQDPESEQRQIQLMNRRALYEYDTSYLHPLPLLNEVPKEEDFSIRYITERVMATAELPANMLASKTRSFLDPLDELQDFEDFFTLLPLPPVAKVYQTDRSFAEQRLGGVNPLVLRRITPDIALPPKLTELPMLKFQCKPEDCIFVADYSGTAPYYTAPANIAGGTYEKGRKYLPKPRAFFWWRWADVRDRGELVPIGIQLDVSKPDECCTPFDAPTDWLFSKLCVQIADGNHHEMSSHLGRTHLVMEPIAIGTARQLAENHPVSLLLTPHFRFMLVNNNLARRVLINLGGFVDRLLAGTLAESVSIVKESYETWSIKDFAFPTEIKSRRMDDLNLLPHYPYRDDGQLIWDAIHTYVTDYLRYFYPNPASLATDTELQAWAQELASSDGGNIKDMPDEIQTVEELIELVTTIVFICSAQHSAVNYGQYDYIGFVANMPLAAYQDPTHIEGTTTEEKILKLLPPYKRVADQLQVMFTLSAYHYDRLGFYDKTFKELYNQTFEETFEGTPIDLHVQKFQQSLNVAEQKIDTNNQKRLTPYPYLKPSLILNSISI